MNHIEPIIHIKNLVKSYGNTRVLKDINLEVHSGQVIGYIGPNGAGKSTTVRLLCGLDGDFGGDISIKNMSIRDETLAVKKLIGYIPEVTEIYDVLTPVEYLHLIGQLHGLSIEQIDKKITRLLELFDLSSHKHNRMDTYSKGMRQKVLIISGLIHDPELIFMDEPMAGLDANSVLMVKELITMLAKEGKTIFYCSHLMDIVEKISDRIILIDNGNIIADGSFEALKAKYSGSLESIFATVTGETDQEQKAKYFIQAMKS